MDNLKSILQNYKNNNLSVEETIEKITSLPSNYEDVKDSYLNFMDTAFLIDIKMEDISKIADKTNKATDNFAKYLLKRK